MVLVVIVIIREENRLSLLLLLEIVGQSVVQLFEVLLINSRDFSLLLLPIVIVIIFIVLLLLPLLIGTAHVHLVRVDYCRRLQFLFRELFGNSVYLLLFLFFILLLLLLLGKQLPCELTQPLLVLQHTRPELGVNLHLEETVVADLGRQFLALRHL